MRTKESLPSYTRSQLLDYFRQGALPRERWQVGLEVEKMGRDARTGRPLAYEGDGACIRRVIELYRERRPADPVFEATHLIGLDGEWGTLSLEPGGQVEWSSRPQATLGELRHELSGHLTALRAVGDALGVRWLALGLDPVHSVAEMPWMPKARYRIMRDYLGQRGPLAHRMMTQTTSIQCAFDYADEQDWQKKFKAAALLAPVATALFANSEQVDGGPSGHRSYRQVIWQQTDPDRCGIPAVVFQPGFDMERWLDWMLDVPTIFRHRARGLVPASGLPFRQLMQLTGCNALRSEDWETHASTIFTEVRSYTYIEVRSADLQPDEAIFAVPSFWTGILYEEQALAEALELASRIDSAQSWQEAMRAAARDGLDGRAAGTSLRDLAREALRVSHRGLARGAACVADATRDSEPLARLMEEVGP
jgi:glutamate--cysteine ligase